MMLTAQPCVVQEKWWLMLEGALCEAGMGRLLSTGNFWLLGFDTTGTTLMGFATGPETASPSSQVGSAVLKNAHFVVYF